MRASGTERLSSSTFSPTPIDCAASTGRRGYSIRQFREVRLARRTSAVQRTCWRAGGSPAFGQVLEGAGQLAREFHRRDGPVLVGTGQAAGRRGNDARRQGFAPEP